MNVSAPQPVAGLVGLVSRGRYGLGSKSEREAVFLDSDRGRFLLRRKTGPAFGDTEFDRYVGTQVECSGFLIGSTLLVDTIRVCP